MTQVIWSARKRRGRNSRRKHLLHVRAATPAQSSTSAARPDYAHQRRSAHPLSSQIASYARVAVRSALVGIAQHAPPPPTAASADARHDSCRCQSSPCPRMAQRAPDATHPSHASEETGCASANQLLLPVVRAAKYRQPKSAVSRGPLRDCLATALISVRTWTGFATERRSTMCTILGARHFKGGIGLAVSSFSSTAYSIAAFRIFRFRLTTLGDVGEPSSLVIKQSRTGRNTSGLARSETGRVWSSIHLRALRISIGQSDSVRRLVLNASGTMPTESTWHLAYLGYRRIGRSSLSSKPPHVFFGW